MAGMISVFLKVTEKIKCEMDKGKNYEDAKEYAYKFYKEELKIIKGA